MEHALRQGGEAVRVEPEFVDVRQGAESSGLYCSDVVVAEGELHQRLQPLPHVPSHLPQPVVPQSQHFTLGQLREGSRRDVTCNKTSRGFSSGSRGARGPCAPLACKYSHKKDSHRAWRLIFHASCPPLRSFLIHYWA